MVHLNITPLYEVIDSKSSDKIFMISQYLLSGSIEDRIEESKKGLPEEDVQRAFRQLISALHYCHEVKNVAHRGVKPSNMLI